MTEAFLFLNHLVYGSDMEIMLICFIFRPAEFVNYSVSSSKDYTLARRHMGKKVTFWLVTHIFLSSDLYLIILLTTGISRDHKMLFFNYIFISTLICNFVKIYNKKEVIYGLYLFHEISWQQYYRFQDSFLGIVTLTNKGCYRKSRTAGPIPMSVSECKLFYTTLHFLYITVPALCWGSRK